MRKENKNEEKRTKGRQEGKKREGKSQNRAEDRPQRTLTIKEMSGKECPKKRHQRTTRVIEGKYENMGPWELGKEEVKFEKPFIKLAIMRIWVI